MKNILLIFIFLFGLVTNIAAQNISGSTMTAITGTSINFPINFTAGTVGVSTMQFDLVLPIGIVSPNPAIITTGLAASSAGKAASSNILSNGRIRILIFGLNQNIIPSGNIVNISLNITAGIAAGIYLTQVINIVSSDKLGNSVPTTGTNLEIVVVLPSTEVFSPKNLKFQ